MTTEKDLGKVGFWEKLGSIRDIIFIIIGLSYFYFIKISEKNNIKIFLQENFGENILNIISIFIFFLLSLGIFGILIFIIHKIIGKIILKTKSQIDDLFLDETIKFLNKTKYIFSIYFSFLLVNFGEKTSLYINKTFLTIITVISVIFFSHIFSIFFDKVVLKNKRFQFLNKSLASLSEKAVIFCIRIFGIITILSNLGFNVTALVAGAGVGGLAFAFAAQKSIANIFGAITILLNKPFTIGDYVNVNGIEGTVRDLGLTYITIIQRDGHQVMVPNETIISTNVENFTVRESRRSESSIGLVYGTTLEEMKKGVEIIEDILQKHKDNKEISSYRVNFEMFGDFSLNIQVVYFSKILALSDFGKQKEKINLEIKQRFGENNLEMAFPTQELILKREE